MVRRTIPLRKIAHLSPLEWLLLAETGLNLGFAFVAVAVLPFRVVIRFANNSSAKPLSAKAAAEVSRVRWAIEAVAPRLPWRAVCIEKGLTAQMMLGRRGIPSQLHYGIKSDGLHDLKAHVWVTADDFHVVGTREAREFVRVATFPAGSGF